MIRAAMILAALAAPAAAESHRHEWHRIGQSPAYVEVVPNADEPGEYVIRFRNERAHGQSEDFSLSMGGEPLRLRLHFRAGDGPETVEVIEAPAGWEYWPEAIEVQEGESGVIYLWPVIMGMG